MSIKKVYPVKKEKHFEDFCRLPIFLVSTIGFDYVDTARSMRKKILMKCYFLATIISQIYVFAFIAKATYALIISDNFQLSLFLRLLSGFNYALFGSIKCVSLLWHKQGSNEIYNKLKAIFPKTQPEKVAHKVHQHFWPKWMLCIIYFYLGAVTFIATSPLLQSVVVYLVGVFKVGWAKAQFGYIKLYDIDYSFDHRSPLAYLVTYAMELMHGHFVILFNISPDLWLLCFTLQLCMHFDYLIRLIEEYQPDVKKLQKDTKFIGDLVKRHDMLLNLSDELNAVFGVLLLFLLMSTAATLCCAGIYTLTQGLGPEFFAYAAFLPIVIGQYYLICYYGEKLTTMSQNVADAAYNHAWYNGSPSYKKSIFIIIIRSQRTVELNACGYQSISLEAFQMIMGIAYRVFTLLRETIF